MNNGVTLPPMPNEGSAAQVAEAQRAANVIIDNDQQSIKNLMVSAWMVADLEQRGVDMTDYKAQIRTLYSEIISRQQLLTDNCDCTKENLYGSVLDPYLDAIVNNKQAPKIGIAPVVWVIVIVIVLAASSSFLDSVGQSKTNSRFTLKETETVKQGLAAIEKEHGEDFKDRFIQDIEKQADRHTANTIFKENLKKFFNRTSKWLLYGGLALGALWLWANYGGNFKKKW